MAGLQGVIVRIPVTIFAAFVLAHASAHAEDNQVQRGPVPDWAIPSDLMPVPDDAGGMFWAEE